MSSSYTDQELKDAIKVSKTFSDTLKLLGIKVCGGNYWTIKKKIILLDIDISHFPKPGQVWNKGNYTSLENLKTKAAIKKNLLRQRGHQCEECKNTLWNEKSIPIELHHIDGNRFNDIEKNLQLLCPNCHAQTDTWKAGLPNNPNKKYKGLVKQQPLQPPQKIQCKNCTNLCLETSKSGLCVNCGHFNRRKVERPSLEVLQNQIKELGYCGTGRFYSVSDSTIRKWIKNC